MLTYPFLIASTVCMHFSRTKFCCMRIYDEWSTWLNSARGANKIEHLYSSVTWLSFWKRRKHDVSGVLIRFWLSSKYRFCRLKFINAIGWTLPRENITWQQRASLDYQSNHVHMTTVSEANEPIIVSNVSLRETGSFAQFLAKERNHLQLFPSIRKKTLASDNREKEGRMYKHSPSRQASSNENGASNNWKIIERIEAIPYAISASDLSPSCLSNAYARMLLTDTVTHPKADVSRVGSQPQLQRTMISIDDTSDDSPVVALRCTRQLDSYSNLNMESVRNANATKRYCIDERKVHRSRYTVRQTPAWDRKREK